MGPAAPLLGVSRGGAAAAAAVGVALLTGGRAARGLPGGEGGEGRGVAARGWEEREKEEVVREKFRAGEKKGGQRDGRRQGVAKRTRVWTGRAASGRVTCAPGEGRGSTLPVSGATRGVGRKGGAASRHTHTHTHTHTQTEGERRRKPKARPLSPPRVPALLYLTRLAHLPHRACHYLPARRAGRDGRRPKWPPRRAGRAPARREEGTATHIGGKGGVRVASVRCCPEGVSRAGICVVYARQAGVRGRAMQVARE